MYFLVDLCYPWIGIWECVLLQEFVKLLSTIELYPRICFFGGGSRNLLPLLLLVPLLPIGMLDAGSWKVYFVFLKFLVQIGGSSTWIM